MHLGLINGPLVPHNLISAQESLVPLPNFQVAPRLKILMSSGSKKGTQIYYPFLSKRSPSESPPVSQGREIPAYRAFLRLFWYISFYLSLRDPGKGAPSMFLNRVPMDRDTLSLKPPVYLFIQSFIQVRLSESPKRSPPMGKNISSSSTKPYTDRRPT
jgi:hypothetical protein